MKLQVSNPFQECIIPDLEWGKSPLGDTNFIKLWKKKDKKIGMSRRKQLKLLGLMI